MQVNFKTLWFLLLLTFFSVTNVSGVEITTVTVQGSVVLPQVAPVEGTTIEITLHGSGVGDFKETVQFAAGESTKAYSIDIPSIASVSWYRYYNCKAGCESYVNHHFYRDTFTGGVNQTGVDLAVVEAIHIKGVFRLPQAFEAPQSEFGSNDLSIEIQLEGNITDPNSPHIHEMQQIQITDRDVSGSFDFKITKTPSQQLRLSYRCHYNGENIQGCAGFGFIETGQYNEQGTVFEIDNATLLSAETNQTGLVLEMLGFSVKATDAIANEETGDHGEFTVNRSGNNQEPLTINFTLSGTATEGVDYSVVGTSITIPSGKDKAVIIIDPINNNDPTEQNETVIITLNDTATNPEKEARRYAPKLSKNKTAAKVESSLSATSASITIVSKAIIPTVTITATDGAEGGENGKFTITRTGDTTTALDVAVIIDPFATTATPNTDYKKIFDNTEDYNVTIPAGQSYTDVIVDIIDDSIIETTEIIFASIFLVRQNGISWGTGGKEHATVSISDNEEPTTDTDGISNLIENNAPNYGDGNNDGKPDSTQNNVASFQGSSNSSYITLEVNSSACQIGNAGGTTEVALSNDQNFNYPIGLAQFTLDCISPRSSADVIIYFHGLTSAPSQLRKYGFTSASPTSKVWYQMPGAIIEPASGFTGSTVYKATYTLTDGGLGDDDLIANGIIIDPVGSAFRSAPAVIQPPANTPPTTIPTLSEWVKYLLMLSLIVIGVMHKKKSLIRKQ